MDQLRVAVLQTCSTDDLQLNQKNILQRLKGLSHPNQLDVVFLPENVLYIRVGGESPSTKLEVNDPVLHPFQKWAQENQVHIVFGSNPLKSHDESKVYNATFWVQPDGGASVPYSKIHLFDVDVEGQKSVRESDHFLPGDSPSIIEINGWKVGLSICYDIRFPELYLQYAKQNVDIILVPAAFLIPTGKAHWESLLRARAIESQCFVLAPAQSGTHLSQYGDSVRESYGHSLAIGPWGEVLGSLGDEEWGGIELTLSKGDRQKVTQQIPMAGHRTL